MNVTGCNIHSIIKAAKGVIKNMLTLISIRQSATRTLELTEIHQCENILRFCVGSPNRVSLTSVCLDTDVCGRMDITELTGEKHRPKGPNIPVCCSEILQGL